MDPRTKTEWEYDWRFDIDPVKGNELLQLLYEESPGWRSKKFGYGDIYRVERTVYYYGKSKSSPLFQVSQHGDEQFSFYTVRCSNPPVSLTGNLLIQDEDMAGDQIKAFFKSLGFKLLIVVKERHRLFTFKSNVTKKDIVDCHLSEIIYQFGEKSVVDFEFGMEARPLAHPADVRALKSLLKDYVDFNEPKELSREVFACSNFSLRGRKK